jgi:hypothetical protein
MSRGKRPVVATAEAKRYAVAAGFLLIELITEAELPIDFVVRRDGITSLVRVRRLKQAGFRVVSILMACAQPIQEMRNFSCPEGLVLELWVRGPARAFHRYRITPETVEEIGIVNQPKIAKTTVKERSGVSSQKAGGNPVKTVVPGNPVEMAAGMASPEISESEKPAESSGGTSGIPSPGGLPLISVSNPAEPCKEAAALVIKAENGTSSGNPV